jgi:hypothetical protein
MTRFERKMRPAHTPVKRAMKPHTYVQGFVIVTYICVQVTCHLRPGISSVYDVRIKCSLNHAHISRR